MDGLATNLSRAVRYAFRGGGRVVAGLIFSTWLTLAMSNPGSACGSSLSLGKLAGAVASKSRFTNCAGLTQFPVQSNQFFTLG